MQTVVHSHREALLNVGVASEEGALQLLTDAKALKTQLLALPSLQSGPDSSAPLGKFLEALKWGGKQSKGGFACAEQRRSRGGVCVCLCHSV